MTGTDIAKAAPMGLEEQIHYAQAMAGASLLPEAYRKQPANILIAMQAGESLGITPFQAIQGIDVIKGKMSLSAELMRALILRDGHTLRVDVLTENGCRLLVARREHPDEVQQFDYTIEDAKRAGLTGGNWALHPKAMLLARCTTMAARAVFADVIGGMASTEEAHDEPEVRRYDTTRVMPTAPVVEETMHIVDEATGEIVEAVVASPVDVDELPY
jgi:hypothetical protein